MTINCDRCHREIPESESFQHLSLTLCEDCYMDALQPNRTCDPWAVYAAAQTREQAGLEGTEGLTTLQQAIYAFVKNRGKATPQEIATKFSLSERDFHNQFATLRHCELVKGKKEGERVYIVPFDA